jgi:hypothetical protein
MDEISGRCFLIMITMSFSLSNFTGQHDEPKTMGAQHWSDNYFAIDGGFPDGNGMVCSPNKPAG